MRRDYFFVLCRPKHCVSRGLHAKEVSYIKSDTILVASNMTGFDQKKKQFVIRKSKILRCFKSIKNLPVDYNSNKKAWMTKDIFSK